MSSVLGTRLGIAQHVALCHKLPAVPTHYKNATRMRTAHGRHRSTVWKEGRGLYMSENEPFCTTHRFEVISTTPEKAIHTNPDTGDGLKVPHFHPGYKVEGLDRQLMCCDDFPDNPQLPEAMLRRNASAFQGTMAPYIVGVYAGKEKGPHHNLGSGYLLTPNVKPPSSEKEVVYIGTAAHNVESSLLRYRVGAKTWAQPFDGKMVDMIPEKVITSWSLDRLVRRAVAKLDGSAPRPESVATTPGYPPLHVPVDAKPSPIPNSPDVVMLQLDAEESFPFNQANDWTEGVKKDWLVPAYIPTNDLMRRFIAIAGIAGSVTDLEQVQDMYGAKDREAAEKLAEELSSEILPAQVLLVAAGDVIADNGLFLYHRASALAGMSGAAVRSLEQPQLLLGTHIGAGEYEYNVATSVNHPVWCALYVQHILPTIMDVREWPAPYMPGALADYLLHHKDLLDRLGLWQQHAQHFVKAHSTSSA